MAKPQAEEGFVMIALDLFVALMTADLPNREAIVLAEILSQSYGPAKRRNVHLDIVGLEDNTGLHRNNVRRAITGLIEANMIARNADGTYRFLKDWESYQPGGEPFIERLNGRLARFARNVKTRFGLIKPSKKYPIQLDCPMTNVGNPVGLSHTGLTPSNGIGSNTDMKRLFDEPTRDDETTSVASLASAPAHAEFKQEDKSKVVQCSTAPLDSPSAETRATTVLMPTPPGPPDPAMEPPYPNGGALDIGGGNHTLTEAEARAIFTRIWKAWGTARVCNGFFGRQRQHAATTWHAAIQSLVERCTPVRSIELVCQVAGDIEVKQAKKSASSKPKPEIVYHVAPPDSPFRPENRKPKTS